MLGDCERWSRIVGLLRKCPSTDTDDNIVVDVQKPDEINGEFIGTALQDLDINDDTTWDDLTPEQQKAFKKAAAEGKLSSLVDVGAPDLHRSRP